jgi:hypothetical protein
LAENEHVYFLGPQKVAECWIGGLQKLVAYMNTQRTLADRRILWLKRLYLDICHDSGGRALSAHINVNNSYSLVALEASRHLAADTTPRMLAPKPHEAIQSFGGRVDRWMRSGSQHQPNVSSVTAVNVPQITYSAGGGQSNTPLSHESIGKRIGAAVMGRLSTARSASPVDATVTNQPQVDSRKLSMQRAAKNIAALKDKSSVCNIAVCYFKQLCRLSSRL